MVSVYKDGNIIPSCSICREFIMHLGGDVENIEILLDKEGRTIKLICCPNIHDINKLRFVDQ